MKLTGGWVARPETQAVLSALTKAGHQALFVGGCVRNSLLGEAVDDIDIATDAEPEIVTEIAEKAGFKTVPTGFEHGTVTVVSGGVAHEVTTFRRDVETDGRRAVVAFSTSLAEDAARRDFTMNALYATADGLIVDPLGGLDDLRARRVRFVGDPAQRIREDYLRILRFFRFNAWYGDPEIGLDEEGLAACAEHVAGLEGLSRERIGAEFRKLLSAPDPAPAVAAMAQSGVLRRLVPGAEVRALPVLVHLEAGTRVRWTARLAMLGGDDVSQKLRLSRLESINLQLISAEIGKFSNPAELGYRYGTELATEICLCRAAVLETSPMSGWKTEIARGADAVFPVKAADLMPALQGKELGDGLRRLEDRWIASDFKLSRAELLG